MAIETGGEKRGRGRPRKNAGADEGGAARSETPQASAELEFSDHLKSNTEYRRRNKKDVYKWDGERWNGVSTASKPGGDSI